MSNPIKAQDSAIAVKNNINTQPIGALMTASKTPKMNVRNSVNECAQSLKKQNAGKYQNYGIKDCIASIAATKVN